MGSYASAANVGMLEYNSTPKTQKPKTSATEKMTDSISRAAEGTNADKKYDTKRATMKRSGIMLSCLNVVNVSSVLTGLVSRDNITSNTQCIGVDHPIAH
jgi:hypothetical protein